MAPTDRSVKRKQPRLLTAEESLDSLTPWKSHVTAYFRDDPTWGPYAAADATWNTAEVNWGYTDDTDADDIVTYSAAQKKADCENFLHELTCYMPSGYIRDRVTKASNSLDKVFDYIFSFYGCKITQDTMPELMILTKNKGESHLQFFYRLLYHQRMHLMTKANEAVEDATVTEQGDRMSVSHMNLVALLWMDRIHKDLNARVRIEYGVRLKRGDSLAGMVEDIAANIPTLLKDCKTAARTETSGVDQVVLERQVQAEVKRFIRNNTKKEKTAKEPFKNEVKKKAWSSQQHCKICLAIKKKLGLTEIDSDHFYGKCPRKNLTVNKVDVKDEADDDSEQSSDENSEGITSSDGKPLFISTDIHDTHLQTNEDSEASVDSSDEELEVPEKKKRRKFSSYKKKTLKPYFYHDVMNSAAVQWLRRKFNKFEKHHSRLDTAKSPAVNVSFQRGSNNIKRATLDEGAEITCLNKAVADALQIPYRSTPSSATTAGSSSLKLAGETKESVIVKVCNTESTVYWDLGICAIVEGLSN